MISLNLGLGAVHISWLTIHQRTSLDVRDLLLEVLSLPSPLLRLDFEILPLGRIIHYSSVARFVDLQSSFIDKSLNLRSHFRCNFELGHELFILPPKLFKRGQLLFGRHSTSLILKFFLLYLGFGSPTPSTRFHEVAGLAFLGTNVRASMENLSNLGIKVDGQVLFFEKLLISSINLKLDPVIEWLPDHGKDDVYDILSRKLLNLSRQWKSLLYNRKLARELQHLLYRESLELRHIEHFHLFGEEHLFLARCKVTKMPDGHRVYLWQVGFTICSQKAKDLAFRLKLRCKDG